MSDQYVRSQKIFLRSSTLQAGLQATAEDLAGLASTDLAREAQPCRLARKLAAAEDLAGLALMQFYQVAFHVQVAAMCSFLQLATPVCWCLHSLTFSLLRLWAPCQVDAFAERPLEGNPAGVVLLETQLPDPTLLAIAQEINQVCTRATSLLHMTRS